MAEQSGLLRPKATTSLSAAPAESAGDGSSLDTILNVVNIASGAGMLGLPYAIQGAGLISGIFGLGVVLFWNFYCCTQMVRLRDQLLLMRASALPGTELAAAHGTPVSFADVGQFALGKLGAMLVHISVITTLLGAATAYFITANQLLRQTHFYIQPEAMSDTTAMYVNTLLYMCFMYPVACIKSLAPLSKFSFPAIVAILAGFGVIIKLGLDAYGFPSMDEIMSWDALYVPQSFQGFSAFFGVAVFSYGATIIIVEIQESMANTDEFVPTLSTSLWIIWVAYALLGGLTVLIYQQAGPVSDNVMEDLRGGEAAQEPLRIFVVMATLLTWPLAMQPVSTVFGKALIGMGFGVTPKPSEPGYGAVETGTVQAASGVNGDKDSPKELPPTLYYGLRLVLVIFCGVCATSVPNFGLVVSLLGSFAVTLGSFVLPPLFHMVVFSGHQSKMAEVADCALFVLGVATCIFTTTTTAVGVFNGDA